MKNIRRFLLYASFVLLPIGIFAQPIITTAPIVNALEGDTITVAITVQNCNNIASASLAIGYNGSVLQLLGYENVNPSLLTGTFIPGGIPPMFKIAWFTLSPVSIGNGILFELKFIAISAGVSPLIWDTLTQGNNSYSDFMGDELPANFINGSVTVESLAKGFRGNVYLQAPFNAGTGLMNTALATAGHLPLTQPYNTAPWNYAGTESLTSIPTGMVDWIIVELRDSADVTKLVQRRAAILMSDGKILDTDLSDEVSFDSTGMYYVAIDHRNHMPVMTAAPINIPDTNSIDLITNTAAVYGSGARINVAANINAMIAGDVSKNGQLRFSGGGNDRSLILTQIIAQTGSTAINTTINGYYKEDVSMNGQVRYSGAGNDPAIIVNNIVTLTGAPAINGTHNCPVPQAN